MRASRKRARDFFETMYTFLILILEDRPMSMAIAMLKPTALRQKSLLILGSYKLHCLSAQCHMFTSPTSLQMPIICFILRYRPSHLNKMCNDNGKV